LNTISIAGILGEAGDLSKFSHGNALLRHAGLHLVEASSGKWRGQTVISKRGRSRLRRFLYMATMNLINNNQEFKARHTYNVQERDMRRMKSLMKLIGKFARILVGMTKNQESYNPEKIQLLNAA
jgi:transposase